MLFDLANPDPRPGRDLGGELNPEQKQAAFDDVTNGVGYFEVFDFRIRNPQGDYGNFLPPIILWSMAGIESDWLQYETRFENDPASGVRTNRAGCDYGIMQVNSVFHTGLFAENGDLSLRRDTHANIAAGAEVLAGWWNAGIAGDLPIVNDADPTAIINWYYALSSYNGGPGGPASWANNPNCTPQIVTFNCHGNDFTASRNPNTTPWVWTALSPGSFPYQERILYNIDTPRQPFGLDTQWDRIELGLFNFTRPRSYGIRPDDSLFITATTGASRAPNLVLFRTRTATVDTNTNPQEIIIEYDLPVEAMVTIELVDGNYVPTDPGATSINVLLDNEPRHPVDGFNQERIPYEGVIGEDYGYFIRIEAGEGVLAAEGAYIRPIMLERDDRTSVFLPLIQASLLATHRSSTEVIPPLPTHKIAP